MQHTRAHPLAAQDSFAIASRRVQNADRGPATHQGFSYSSLLQVAQAQNLLGASQPVFATLATSDFERVLLALWFADVVNTSLGSQSAAITTAYHDARNALIQAVHSVHCLPGVTAHAHQNIGRFAQRFKTIVTFNYDLTLYWALMDMNNAFGAGNWFKDGFVGAGFTFDPNWQRLRQPHNAAGATMFFYGHGSVVLSRDQFGQESKIVNPAIGPVLLNTITAQWQQGSTLPIFVSEGTARDKLQAIRRSVYLSTVYDGVLAKLGRRVIAYGLSFASNDEHILDAMAQNPPDELAVSVFTGAPVAQQQAFCYSVNASIVAKMPGTNVRFFNHASSGCWNNP